jgi:hypothetical protein
MLHSVDNPLIDQCLARTAAAIRQRANWEIMLSRPAVKSLVSYLAVPADFADTNEQPRLLSGAR